MRSGYSDDVDGADLAMWRGRAVASSIRGKRGQAFFRDCLAALDAMPEKRLIPNLLIEDGEVCLLGTACKKQDYDLDTLDPEDHDAIGNRLNIAACLVQEVEYINDEAGPYHETPEQRFERVRRWVVRQIKADAESVGAE